MNTRIKTSLLGGAALIALCSFSMIAAAKFSKAGGATAGFHATGPGGLGIDGSTSDVEVADDGSTVTITVQLGSLKTGMDIRDKHTKEDLEADKFGTAQLKVPRASIKASGEGDAKGTFVIHGQSKETTFHYKTDGSNAKGTAKINVKDFGVKPRSYLGVSIKDEVEVFANIPFKDG
jgi:polyisoprenoid-binding protein YceI